MHDGFTLQAREFEGRRVPFKKLTQKECLLGEAGSSLILGKKIAKLIAEHGRTAWLQSDNRHSLIDGRRKSVQNLPQQRLCALQHAEIVKRAATTQAGFRQKHSEPSRLQHLHCGFGGVREKVIVEGVRPQKHWRLTCIAWSTTPEPGLERLRSKRRNAPLRRYPGRQLGNISQERKLGGEVDQPWNMGSQTRPRVDIAKGVRAERSSSAFVIVGEELCLVSCHIHADGAVTFAAFARQAQVERLFDVFVAPAILNYVAFGHLPEQVCPAASRMFFLAGHPEARAHDAAFIMTALAHSHAAQGSVRQASVIVGKLKMGGRFPG